MVQIASAVEDFLADKGKGEDSDSGTYHRDARRELDRFQGFLEEQSPAPTRMDELTTHQMRSYARHLSRQGWQADTTRTCYNLVSAFIGWAVREGYLDEHLATRRRATEPLATDETEEPTRQQAWSPAERSALTEYVDDLAAEAVDAAGEDRERAIKATRDRAIVYLLAYSGVRGAEVFRERDRNDPDYGTSKPIAHRVMR